MALELKPLKIADHQAVIDAAIAGMLPDDYLSEGVLLQAYGRYFFYDHLLRATHVLAAYEGDTLAGVMLVRLNSQPPATRSWWRSAFVRGIGALDHLSRMGRAYAQANAAMLSDYLTHSPVDGEISFLVAIPGTGIKGVGRYLLGELARLAPGKHLFLYTDDGCNYGFYDAMGFSRTGTRTITFPGPKKKDSTGPRPEATLECMMYTVTLPTDV
ncbi:GNAT family N-acetyltransferase [Corynebacterium sp. 13CS0277]|uniref:GNAT family N-acetyltransferase n=1 Tax=Corynebacterium sp. 13CS0277 TaxID=2071994 RepID=UPI000D03D69C|nr:GNAT family N-acetyltransferase [Corynebacterium sp. 13CS0277]PRQ10879.1 GNAT family N-acetyltransferase [Corynebacterium sp. 13CS0277]